LFDSKFEKKEIKFECERIGKSLQTTEENDGTVKPRMVRIRFSNIWDKRSIYANRIKNLQQTGIFMNEDLMPDKVRQAYMARKLRREGKIYSTFTSDGFIFIKETEFSEPKELTEDVLRNLMRTNETQELFLSCSNSQNSI
jgi:hypothetical protein